MAEAATFEEPHSNWARYKILPNVDYWPFRRSSPRSGLQRKNCSVATGLREIRTEQRVSTGIARAIGRAMRVMLRKCR